MAKQMNEYVLLFSNAAESSPLPDFGATFNKWAEDNGVTSDVIRTEPASNGMTVVCTEDIARRAIAAFSGTVGSVRMEKENVITIPAPLQKKTRSPGFGTV